VNSIDSPSKIGIAPPSFVHSAAEGVTSTPGVPRLNAQQFGATPNWNTPPPNHAASAIMLGAQTAPP